MSAGSATASDRFNPILVKEVRASLRARIFRVVFQIVLLGTVLVAVLALATLDPESDHAGRRFFEPIYFCLCVALLGVIPLSAFFSMGSEWDENTYDLLAISNLRPRQIVLGKLLSSSIEALLYFSAFAPILVLAFLLRGVDIGQVLLVLATTFGASVGSAGAAIGLSSLGRARAARVLLLVVLGGLLLALIAGVMQTVAIGLNRPGVFAASFVGDFLFSILGLTCGAGALGLAVACERLAHPEENHSSGPRVVVTVLYAAYLAWAAIWMSAHWYVDGAAIGLTLVTLAHVFFATERETLTRRVQRQVPRSGGLALLATPFLPGGGRAILLFCVHLLMAVVFGILAEAHRPSASTAPSGLFERAQALIVFAGYLFIYVAGITLPFSRRTDEVRMRWIARVAVPLIALLSIFAPSILDFLFAKHRYVEMKHPLNPFWVLEDDVSDITLNRICVVLAPLVVVVFLANLGRLDRAWREVQKASRDNRERAQARESVIVTREAGA